MKTNQQSGLIKDNNSLLQKTLLPLIVISVFTFCFATKGASTVYAKSEKKTIKLSFSRNPQLKFTDVKVGQRNQKLDENFDAENDWVKNPFFKLKNISGKSIVFMTVNVNFPETRATGNLMSYSVTFGQRPGSKITNREPMLLKPDEIIDVSLDKEKGKIYKFVNSRQPIELIQTVELENGFIVFDDKTAWSAGAFMHQDPNNPDRYNPIETETP
jgi:hypothetical protein